MKATKRKSPTRYPKSSNTSYFDAAILEHLASESRATAGSLPLHYHVGRPVKVKMHIKQDYQYRTIWMIEDSWHGIPDDWVWQ